MLDTFVSLVLIGLLWGGTNPLIRRGSLGVDKVVAASAVGQIIAELWFLVTRWQYMVPFLLNQCGGVLYLLTLQDNDLSLAVPVANSLSFVFTAISALIVGEQRATTKTYVGMALVMVGTSICMYEKQTRDNLNPVL